MAQAITIDGNVYASMTQASKSLGINRMTLVSRLKVASASGKELSTKDVDFSITIGDITFNNVTEAAEYYGINRNTFYSRVKAGWTGNRLTAIESLKHKGKATVVYGKAFPMVKDMLAYYDISQSNYHALKRKGHTTLQAVKLLTNNASANKAKARISCLKAA